MGRETRLDRIEASKLGALLKILCGEVVLSAIREAHKALGGDVFVSAIRAAHKAHGNARHKALGGGLFRSAIREAHKAQGGALGMTAPCAKEGALVRSRAAPVV